jgi:hypothetical protein
MRPSNQQPHRFDKPLRGQSTDDPWTDSGGVAGICMKMLPPSSCGMPLVTAASCGFLRDGIEERGGEGDGQAKDVQPETQRQGRGCSTPLPVEPPPPGGDSPIDALPREETTTSRSHLTLPEIRFPSPVHGIRTIATHCPPPRKGAGGGRGSGRAVGVSHEYRSTRDTGDRGGSVQS